MSDLITRQPHTFTLGEAAKAAGVSKPTLSKAIKTGRISATPMPDGSYSIQPAELFRVYPPAPLVDRQPNPGFNRSETGKADGLHAGEVDRLREQLTALTTERERERRQFEDQVSDLRRRLDLEGEERRKLTAILTDDRAKPAEPTAAMPHPQPAQQGGRGLFRWFKGRG